MWGRVCAVGLLAAALTGCDEMDVGLPFLVRAPDATAQGIRTLRLLDGAVRVRGPGAYCVDQNASRARDGFAVMAGCALMSGSAAGMPGIDGLITVQFGDENTASIAGNEAAFAGFIASDAGRALLASDGNAANVEQVETIADLGGVLARFEDLSGPAVAGTTGPQWRGFLDIDGRLVTVSVLSFARQPMTRAEGERLLVVTMAELSEVNATPDTEGPDGT